MTFSLVIQETSRALAQRFGRSETPRVFAFGT
jgi:hypothetical protein